VACFERYLFRGNKEWKRGMSNKGDKVKECERNREENRAEDKCMKGLV
jgi:hypothetical protein